MTLRGSLNRLALLAALGISRLLRLRAGLGRLLALELWGFTILAFIFAAAFIVHMVRLRRAMQTPGAHEALMREAHVYRERRGF